MEQERRAIRWGVVLILLAAVWRVATGGAGTSFFDGPRVAALLVSMATGREVHLPLQHETEEAQLWEPEQPTEPQRPALFFSGEESELVDVYALCSYPVDITKLLTQPLCWDLTENDPAVLILHTHATESYEKNAQNYQEHGEYRTLDEDYNMLRVGQEVADGLRALGITAIHDTELHDYPSYTGSYNNSRTSAKVYLEQYPSLRVVLDLHRDAAENPNGSQMDTSATVDGKESAQLMFVVGTNASGLEHPNWQENMALAVKLQAILEKRWPGICRPICFREERFNQDLMGGALLVEVGAAGNTQEEALLAARCLSWALGQLAYGAN